MKARIFGFLCSLLLLAASSKGQAIDGVLYTNFNNYYKWRGGAFDSTLLLPQIAASVGRRAGALRYNTTDSSVYSWTGWQWRKVGVELDTTSLSNRIDARVVIGSDASLKSLTITGTNGNGHIHLRHQASQPTATGQSTVIYANNSGDFAYKNDGNYHTTFATSANTADRTYTFQNKSYTVADNADVVKYTDTAAMLSPYLRSINAGVRWQGVDSMFAKLLVENGYHYAEEFNMITTTLTTNTNLLGTRIAVEPRSGNITAINDTLGTGVRLGTSTSASANPIVYTGQTGSTPISFPISANDWNLFTTRVRIPTLNDGTQKFVVLVGLQSTIGINQAQAYYFTYDLDGSATSSAASANWQTVTALNNSRTFTTTSTAVAANTYTKLSILYNSRAAYFYIDGVLVATHTTNLQPAGQALGIWTQLVKTAGTTARTVDVDYFTLDIKYNTPR